MKFSLFFGLISLLYAATLSAQRVYEVDTPQDATHKAQVVQSPNEADLVVFKTDSRYDADDAGIWYIVDSHFEAHWKVYFVASEKDADLKIYYTDSRYEAGWQNENKRTALQ